MVIKIGEKYDILRAAFNDIVSAIEEDGIKLKFETESSISELLEYHFGLFIYNDITEEELEDHGWKEV